VWEDDLREAGSCSNPRMRPNWTQHDTWAKIRCGSTVGRKRSLHQNNDCGHLRHDMDLRFDTYESRCQELSRKYLHARIQVDTWSGRPSQAVAVLESECHRGECNSVSFLSVVPRQKKHNTCFHCLDKMNKKVGTRVLDCLVGGHELE
jgi:hypothetical protein